MPSKSHKNSKGELKLVLKKNSSTAVMLIADWRRTKPMTLTDKNGGGTTGR